MATKNITKKEFINILSNNKTALVFCRINLKEDLTTKVIETSVAEYNRLQQYGEFRDAEKVTSTYIKFSDTSKLYFEGKTKYFFANNNLLLAVKTYNDSFDNTQRWQILAYLLKEN